MQLLYVSVTIGRNNNIWSLYSISYDKNNAKIKTQIDVFVKDSRPDIRIMKSYFVAKLVLFIYVSIYIYK